MKLNWRYELPQLLLIGAMLIIAALAWPQLPDRLPIHWNIHGEIDGWGSKFMGLLLFPCIMVGLYALLVVVPFIDPGRANYKNFEKSYGIIRIALMAFMTVFYCAIVYVGFGHKLNMTSFVFPLAGVLLMVLGNFMGKVRPNWFVGVRTPWTLSSRLSWDKTHRLAGWLMMFMGVLFVLLAFRPTISMLITVLVTQGVCILWMVVYSYLVYRNDPNRTSPAGATAGVDDQSSC